MHTIFGHNQLWTYLHWRRTLTNKWHHLFVINGEPLPTNPHDFTSIIIGAVSFIWMKTLDNNRNRHLGFYSVVRFDPLSQVEQWKSIFCESYLCPSLDKGCHIHWLILFPCARMVIVVVLGDKEGCAGLSVWVIGGDGWLRRLCRAVHLSHWWWWMIWKAVRIAFL